MNERLQKHLAQLGLGSRREAETWIKAGRVTVNGVVATVGLKVGPEADVRLDGRRIRRRATQAGIAFIANRSPGDPLQQSTSPDRDSIMERLPKSAGRRSIAISPMPRIDGGLELVTSDGALAEQLQRAARQTIAAFSVRVHGELRDEQLDRIRQGELDSGEHVQVLGCEAGGGEASNRWYTLESRGAAGKEIRQLFERQGALVSRVLRTRFGTLVLDRTLPRGKLRRLRPEEIEALIGESLGAREPAVRSPQSRRRISPARRKIVR